LNLSDHREIYLDNSATTQVYSEIADRMREVMVNQYGNPSSLHRKGIEAELLVSEARQQISRSLEASPEEIVFTSGGTEANNLALMGAALAGRRKGSRIVSSEIEHPSVLEALKHLERQGFEVALCPVDTAGRVDPEKLASLVDERTILASVMMVNNETGTIQPVAELVSAAKRKNPGLVFHSDCVQSFGKLPLNPAKTGIDLATLSAHKLHGPKGVGALYISSKTVVQGQIQGGGQERQVRSGTENVPGIVGFGMAAQRAAANQEKDAGNMARLKLLLVNSLRESRINFRINGPSPEEGAAHIVSLAFPGVRGEVLVHFLEAENILVSTGSACHSRTVKVSHVLKAINVPAREAEGSIRVSFSSLNTEEDVELLVQGIRSALNRLKPGR
jgi:cysteine desulfurase